MIKIKNIQGEVIYTSNKAKSIKEAVEEAVKNEVSLSEADLRGANLLGINLSGANIINELEKLIKKTKNLIFKNAKRRKKKKCWKKDK